MQTTDIMAMPAVNSQMAVAPSSEAIDKSNEPTEFARILTGCSSEQTAVSKGRKPASMNPDEKEEILQDDSDMMDDGCCDQQLLSAMACPMDVFAALPVNDVQILSEGQPGMTEESAGLTIQQSYISVVPGVGDASQTPADANIRAMLQGNDSGEQTGIQNSSAQNIEWQQVLAGSEYEAADASEGAIYTGRTAMANADFNRAEYRVGTSVEASAGEATVGQTAPVMNAGAMRNTDSDSSGTGGETADFDFNEYIQFQQEPTESEAFSIENNQISDRTIKIQHLQTDNDSVEAEFSPEAPVVRNAPEIIPEAIRNQEAAVERSVFEQVFDRVSGIEVNGDNQITFALKPDSLGNIKIMVEGSGQDMVVTIETDNQKVKEALSGSLDQLASSLGMQNVKEDQIKIVFTERQDYVNDGLLSSNQDSKESMHNTYPREIVLGTGQVAEDDEPEQLQVYASISRFNQYA